MPLKDYYRLLEVPAAATPEEIKKSFRQLALKYHPDKNTDNPYAAGHFREIREAYAVLADPVRRRAYDEERWLSGMSSRARDQVRITPDWVLHEVRRLRRHMDVIDTARMSHEALRNYVLLLLADEHMDVLHREGDEERNTLIIMELLDATRRLKPAFFRPVTDRLLQLTTSASARDAIGAALKEREGAERWDRYFPMVVIGLAMLLCLIWMLVVHLH